MVEHTLNERPSLPRNSGNSEPSGSSSSGDRSVAGLLRELSADGAALMRQEVALAKAELNRKVDILQRNLLGMAGGVALLLAALLTALWTANRGLTVLLAEVMSGEVAIWLSPLILSVALAITGWSMLSSSKDRLADEGLTPHRTQQSMKANTQWAQDKAHEVKQEMSSG